MLEVLEDLKVEYGSLSATAEDQATEELLVRLLAKCRHISISVDEKVGFKGEIEIDGKRFLVRRQPTIGAVAFHLLGKISSMDEKKRR